MAHPRPAKCYRRVAIHAYTRTAKRVVKKAFVRGVPGSKIVHFDMGNAQGDYSYIVKLISKTPVQIRDSALDSSRVIVNRDLDTILGLNNYHLQIRAYPHHVLRENAIISGAGADRLQTGMRHSFGRPIGRAARIRRGQAIMTVKVKNLVEAEKVRTAYRRVYAKLPTSCAVVIEKIEK